MISNKQKNTTKQADSISGINIFLDTKGRYVYRDRFSKIGYIIPVGSMKSYRSYSLRFFLCLAVFALLADYILAPWLAAIAAVAVYAIIEFRFRKKFLGSLTQVPNFTPAAHESRLKVMARESKSKLIVLILLFIALAILLLLNVWDQNNRGHDLQPFVIYLSYALSAGSIIVAGMYSYALITKKD